MLSPVPFLSNGLQRRDAEYEGFRLIEGWFPAGYASAPHCHPRPGLGVVVDGAMEIILRRGRRDGTPGCFGAEPLDDWHRNLVGRGGVHLVVFEIDPARLESCGSARGFLLNGEACRHGDAVLLARRASRELDLPDSASALVLEATMLELLAIAARPAYGRDEAVPRWLARARELVHARYLERLAVDDIAAAVGVHPVHLARVFRARYRTSVGGYVRSLRLDWAARRLAETDEPIAQIALGAGFADQSHFTRRFREHAGMPPARYRRTRTS